MSLHTDRQQLYDLTETEVALQLHGSTFDQAEAYYTDGHVYDVELEDATLLGVVEERPYNTHVAEVSVRDERIYILCTCGHPGPGICPHVGAVLLVWVRDRPSVAGYDEVYETDRGDTTSPMPDFGDEYRELLGHQTINELRTLARRRGCKIRGTRKEPIIQELTEQLCNLDEVRALVAQLDSVEQELLTWLHLTLGHGYGFTSENIVSGLQQHHAEVSRRTIHTQLVSLAERGLLLTFKQNSLVYYMLPQVVRVCLPPRHGFISPYPEQELDQLSIHERHATTTIQSLYTVWDYILGKRPRRPAEALRQPVEDQWPQLAGWTHLPKEVQEIKRRRRTPYNLHNVSMTVPAAPRRLHRADLNVIGGQSGLVDQEVEFYYMLLEALGAVDAAPGEIVSCRQEVFERVLSLPPSAQMYAIIHTWINSRTWSEMDLLRGEEPEIQVRRNLMYSAFTPEDLYREWRAGRQTVLRFLSTLPEGQWTSVSGFLRGIFEITPDLLHTSTNTATWWLESSRTKKQFGTTFEDWQDGIGRFILAVLKGPLQWLGAVSLAYREDKLVAIKVTPTGSFALQRRQTIVEPDQTVSQEAVRLDDDLTVTLVPGHVPAQVHDLLHFIGKLEQTTPDRFLYRITAEGVLLALEQGQTVDSLLDRIGAWTRSDIPETWRTRMLAWSENYGKLHVYDEITLIELADDYALQELLSNTLLRGHIIHQFSPRLVAIQPGAVDDLIQEMEKRGYTPHVE